MLNQPKKFFITGIGTGVGKTITSAIFCKALNADYWKPIQSGDLKLSDSQIVYSLAELEASRIIPEAYRFSESMSPHASAMADHSAIDKSKIILPETGRSLIIEGAGGVLVPLNDGYLMVDLIKEFDIPVVLVTHTYLGSINHTLLTIRELERQNVQVIGYVLNGSSVPSTESYFIKHIPYPMLLRIGQHREFTTNQVKFYSGIVKDKLSWSN